MLPTTSAIHTIGTEQRAHLLRFATRILGDPERAEDVVQDAMLRLLQQDNPPLAPQAWLMRITKHLAIDRLRRARLEHASLLAGHFADIDANRLRDPVTAETDNTPVAALLRDEHRRALLATLLDTSGPQATALILLREVFDVPYVELAACNGRGEAACRQAVSRALGRVRQRVAEPVREAAGDRGGSGIRDDHAEARHIGLAPVFGREMARTLRRYVTAIVEADPEPLFEALRVSACVGTGFDTAEPAGCSDSCEANIRWLVVIGIPPFKPASSVTRETARRLPALRRLSITPPVIC